MMKSVRCAIPLLALTCMQVVVQAFMSPSVAVPETKRTTNRKSIPPSPPPPQQQQRQRQQQHYVQADPNHFLMDDFRMFNGELLDPYKVLKVHRSAEKVQIRTAYIDLSKRYHPDKVMHKDILPGSCNNLEDVRDQWERIKMSYEILSDNRLRRKYDRHVALVDPGAAVQRAAMEATGNAIKGMAGGVGRGIFSAGRGLLEFGAKAVAERNNNQKENMDKE